MDEVRNDRSPAEFYVDGAILSYLGYLLESLSVKGVDQDPNRTRLECVRADGSLMSWPNGYAIAIVEYDEEGSEVKRSFYDKEGRPRLHRLGYHQVITSYDGLVETESYLDLDERPCRQSNGSAQTVLVYDSDCSLLEELFLDQDGRPCRLGYGFSRITHVYDSDNYHEISRSYWDVDDQPALYDGRYSTVEFVHDADDRLISESYFGKDRNPCLVEEGYHCIRFRYDEHDSLIEEAFFDGGLHPCQGSEGYASVRYEYDEAGRQTAITYLGVDDQPLANKKGYARVERSYNAQGELVEKRYHDSHGRLCRSHRGYAVVRYLYDPSGHVVSICLLDADYRPVNCHDGYSSIEYRYNEGGLKSSEVFFDCEGQSALCRNKYSQVDFSYNSDQLVSKIIFQKGEEGCGGCDQDDINVITFDYGDTWVDINYVNGMNASIRYHRELLDDRSHSSKRLAENVYARRAKTGQTG